MSHEHICFWYENYNIIKSLHYFFHLILVHLAKKQGEGQQDQEQASKFPR